MITIYNVPAVESHSSLDTSFNLFDNLILLDYIFILNMNGTISVFYVHIYQHASTLTFLGVKLGIFVKGGVQQGKQKEY